MGACIRLVSTGKSIPSYERLSGKCFKGCVQERKLFTSYSRMYLLKHLTFNPGGRKDGKLGKDEAKNQISQKCAQDLLQIAPDLCYYGRIMIGDHWGSVERLQYLTANKPLIFL